MKNDIERLLTTDTAKYSDQQCMWLLEHIGDLNGDIRDRIVYGSFCHGFLDNNFSTEQMKMIANYVTENELLFLNIDENNNSHIFTRTFTALLGSLLLHKDKQHPFLTSLQRQKWLEWAITYLTVEKDWRGFINEHGWAHSIAHGSDLLAEAVSHPSFSADQLKRSLLTVKSILNRQTGPFENDEEERLAMIILSHSNSSKRNFKDTLDFLEQLNTSLWTQYQDTEGSRTSYYQISSWKRILMTLYFNSLKYKTTVKPMIDQYFKNMGYLTDEVR